MVTSWSHEKQDTWACCYNRAVACLQSFFVRRMQQREVMLHYRPFLVVPMGSVSISPKLDYSFHLEPS